MGIIKQTSDSLIIDNTQELITPLRVRQVNDVIDGQVEGIQSSITTINQNVTTLSSSSVPIGGLTGQVLAKRSNTDNDVEWIAPPSGGVQLPDGTGHHSKFLQTTDEGLAWSSPLPSGGTTGQVLTKRSNTDNDVEWIDVTADGDFLPLSGGTMTGTINMQENNITNLGRIEENFYDAGSYSNRTIFFEPDAENDVFHVSTHLEYNSDQSSKFSARSLVDKGYVDGEVQSYLPLSGGQMSSTAKIFKAGGLQIDFEQNTINSINTLRGNIFDLDMNAGYVDRAALKYRSDFSASFTARSIPDVEYVDAQKPKKYVQNGIVLGADTEIRTITHNLNTKDLLVILEAGDGRKVIEQYFTTDPNDQAFDGLNKCRISFGSDDTYNLTIIGFVD
ncbi:hypothetical protein WAF17_10895 [Bernardetia sp. ABR2-2B]|uniref:hypothetical protein n=1 Tax=Bernardetia sp. ABR2-2B TaxID=3127472 RepID=UPI0030D48EF0